MTIEQVDDHAAEAIEKLLAQFAGKERIEALLGALVRQLNQIETDVFAMLSQQSIAGAEGAQLDGIGSMLGVTRGGRLDPAYRLAIQKEVLVRTSQGSSSSLINISVDIVEGWNVELIEPANARAELEILARRISDGAVIPYDAVDGGPGWTQAEFDAVFSYLNRARSGGVYFVMLARKAVVEAAWTFTAGGVAPNGESTFSFGGQSYATKIWKGVGVSSLTIDAIGPGAILVGVVGPGGNGGADKGGGGGGGGSVFGELLVPHVIGDVWDIVIGAKESRFDSHSAGGLETVVVGSQNDGGDGGDAGTDDPVVSDDGIVTAAASANGGGGGGGASASGGVGVDFSGGAGNASGGGGGAGGSADGLSAAAGGAGGAGVNLSTTVYGAMLAAHGYDEIVGGGGGGGGGVGGAAGAGGGGAGGVAGAGTAADGPGGGGGGGGAGANGGAGFPGVVMIAYRTDVGPPLTPHVPFAFDGFRGATFDGVNIANAAGGNFQIFSTGARAVTSE